MEHHLNIWRTLLLLGFINYEILLLLHIWSRGGGRHYFQNCILTVLPGQIKSIPLLTTAFFCAVGLIVTGFGFGPGGLIGVMVGCGSVKEGMNEFQNAIFSGSMFFSIDVVGFNEIYSLYSLYAGHVAVSVGFLNKKINSIKI